MRHIIVFNKHRQYGCTDNIFRRGSRNEIRRSGLDEKMYFKYIKPYRH